MGIWEYLELKLRAFFAMIWAGFLYIRKLIKKLPPFREPETICFVHPKLWHDFLFFMKYKRYGAFAKYFQSVMDSLVVLNMETYFMVTTDERGRSRNGEKVIIETYANVYPLSDRFEMTDKVVTHVMDNIFIVQVYEMEKSGRPRQCLYAINFKESNI